MIDTLRLNTSRRRPTNDLLTRGEVSAAESHTVYGEREDDVHAYLRSGSIDKAGAKGIPIAFKDIVSTAGVETTAGSQPSPATCRCSTPQSPSGVAPGACPGSGRRTWTSSKRARSTEYSAYGQPFDPWDLSRVPGGSSGGSAAAVAAGLAPWAPPSEHRRLHQAARRPVRASGDSGRTTGPSPLYGIIAFASSLDQIGPIANTVAHCAFLYSVIAGRPSRYITTVPNQSPSRCPRRSISQGCAWACRCS